MTSIFDFVKEGKSAPLSIPSESRSNSSIFEAAKELPVEKEITRTQSITAAPIQGYLKGLQNAYGSGTGPIPSELANRVFEEVLPTENKAPERLLERGGKIAAYVSGPGALRNKLIRGPAATFGGQLAQEFGFGKDTQEAIETGLLLSPTTWKGAQKYVSSLYGKADSLLPKGAEAEARNLRKGIVTYINDLRMGGMDPSKTASMTKAKEIMSKIQSGKIDVKELTEFKKSINVLRAGLYGEKSLDRKGRASAKRNLDELSSKIDSSLAEYGKENPEWYKPYKEANEGFSGIEKAKRARSWIGGLIKQNPTLASYGILGTIAGNIAAPKTALLTAGGVGLLGIGEFTARLVKSKTLRKYYKDMIKSAIEENKGAFINNLRKLNESLDKRFSKEKEEED